MKVTLAKALKLKNRFASKLHEVSRDIQTYNSMIKGQERHVDVCALMAKRERLVDALINLKTSINEANKPIQSTIYLLAEIKGDVSFLKGISTDSGNQVESVRWGTEDKMVEKDAILDYVTVRGLIEQAESDVDANQDKLDKHNHTVDLDISDDVLALLRG